MADGSHRDGELGERGADGERWPTRSDARSMRWKGMRSSGPPTSATRGGGGRRGGGGSEAAEPSPEVESAADGRHSTIRAEIGVPCARRAAGPNTAPAPRTRAAVEQAHRSRPSGTAEEAGRWGRMAAPAASATRADGRRPTRRRRPAAATAASTAMELRAERDAAVAKRQGGDGVAAAAEARPSAIVHERLTTRAGAVRGLLHKAGPRRATLDERRRAGRLPHGEASRDVHDDPVHRVGLPQGQAPRDAQAAVLRTAAPPASTTPSRCARTRGRPRVRGARPRRRRGAARGGRAGGALARELCAAKRNIERVGRRGGRRNLRARRARADTLDGGAAALRQANVGRGATPPLPPAAEEPIAARRPTPCRERAAARLHRRRRRGHPLPHRPARRLRGGKPDEGDLDTGFLVQAHVLRENWIAPRRASFAISATSATEIATASSSRAVRICCAARRAGAAAAGGRGATATRGGRRPAPVPARVRARAPARTSQRSLARVKTLAGAPPDALRAPRPPPLGRRAVADRAAVVGSSRAAAAPRS